MRANWSAQQLFWTAAPSSTGPYLFHMLIPTMQAATVPSMPNKLSPVEVHNPHTLAEQSHRLGLSSYSSMKLLTHTPDLLPTMQAATMPTTPTPCLRWRCTIPTPTPGQPPQTSPPPGGTSCATP